MKYKVFVDGQEGTTGLKIHQRLETRKDIEILKIDLDKRKEAEERRRMLNAADIAFLCLPDDAAKESVSLVDNPKTKIIDASTAHRTNPQWAYGFPELSHHHTEAIKASGRVSVPGCYATGFNLAVYPLINKGIISADYPVSCHAISGYSGAGKKMIELYESKDPNDQELKSPRLYALGLQHKHLPEMKKVCGLNNPPMFMPIIADYYQGMTVAIPLHASMLSKKYSVKGLQEFFAEYYSGKTFVRVPDTCPDNYPGNGFLSATVCNGTNSIELFVLGNDDQILLVSRLDNLGKGASGAAVQCMNIMLGLDEAEGLTYKK